MEEEFSESDGFKIPLNFPENMNISFSSPLKHISKCPFWYRYFFAFSNDHSVELLLTHFKHYPLLHIWNCFVTSPQHKQMTVQLYRNLGQINFWFQIFMFKIVNCCNFQISFYNGISYVRIPFWTDGGAHQVPHEGGEDPHDDVQRRGLWERKN